MTFGVGEWSFLQISPKVQMSSKTSYSRSPSRGYYIRRDTLLVYTYVNLVKDEEEERVGGVRRPSEVRGGRRRNVTEGSTRVGQGSEIYRIYNYLNLSQK